MQAQSSHNVFLLLDLGAQKNLMVETICMYKGAMCAHNMTLFILGLITFFYDLQFLKEKRKKKKICVSIFILKSHLPFLRKCEDPFSW